MKKLFTLLLVVISNMAVASIFKNIETDTKLNESIALAHQLKSFSQSQKGISFFTVGADGACQYSNILRYR